MAWTDGKTWSAGDVLTASDLNTYVKDDLMYLVSRPQSGIVRNNGGDYTTTSTSFVDIDGTNLSITITPAKTKVLILFCGVGLTSTNAGVYFDVTVDGTRLGGTDGMDVSLWTSGATGSGRGVIMAVTTVTAGQAHTFKVQWKTSTGTATLYANTTYPCFSVLEIG